MKTLDVYKCTRKQELENNDLSEGTAIKRIFKDQIPPFSSTKSFTGHTLAAAAAVEAVFSIMAIKEGIVYKNLNFKNVIPELDIYPEIEVKKEREINNVLSNSFGFGGNNSTQSYFQNKTHEQLYRCHRKYIPAKHI
ncbi:MAG: hypothetical protein HC831_13330 [Chloroflexia bacterium]|nr:hypothetical protein [Chloroflexia bacterium]